MTDLRKRKQAEFAPRHRGAAFLTSHCDADRSLKISSFTTASMARARIARKKPKRFAATLASKSSSDLAQEAGFDDLLRKLNRRSNRPLAVFGLATSQQIRYLIAIPQVSDDSTDLWEGEWHLPKGGIQNGRCTSIPGGGANHLVDNLSAAMLAGNDRSQPWRNRWLL